MGWSRCGSVCGHAESVALGSIDALGSVVPAVLAGFAAPTVLGSKRLVEGM